MKRFLVFAVTILIASGAIAMNVGAVSIGNITGGNNLTTISISTISAKPSSSQYTATLVWNGNLSIFSGDTVYAATIHIIPKSGYTLNGVPSNFFKVSGAATTLNKANSGIVWAIFPSTARETAPPSPPPSPPPPEGTITVVTQGTFYENSTTQTYVCGSRAMDLYPYTTGSKPYIFMIDGCAIDVYDVSNSVQLVTGANLAPGMEGYWHNNFKLSHVALLDDFPYGVASYSTEGWTVFKIQKDGAGRIAGLETVKSYYVGDGNGVGTNRFDAMKLFRIGNHAYLVSKYDMNLDDGLEASFAIYDFGDGTSDPSLTKVATIEPRRVSTIYDILYEGGKAYLYVYGSDVSGMGVFIYDVTNPAAPVYIGKNDDIGFKFPFLFSLGEISVSRPRGTAYAQTAKRLYTFPGKDTFYIYDVTNPKNPVLRGSEKLPDGVISYGAPIAGNGKLLVVLARTPKIAYYYDVAGDDPEFITSIDAPTDKIFFNYSSPSGVALFPPGPGGTVYTAFRSHWMRAFWDKVTIE